MNEQGILLLIHRSHHAADRAAEQQRLPMRITVRCASLCCRSAQYASKHQQRGQEGARTTTIHLAPIADGQGPHTGFA
jgi:hypothetical protein